MFIRIQFLLFYGTRKHAHQVGVLYKNYRVSVTKIVAIFLELIRSGRLEKQNLSTSDGLQLCIIMFFAFTKKHSLFLRHRGRRSRQGEERIQNLWSNIFIKNLTLVSTEWHVVSWDLRHGMCFHLYSLKRRCSMQIRLFWFHCNEMYSDEHF